MKYVERLLADTDYLSDIEELEELEAERIFCRHGLSHALDVARIAWIGVLEEPVPELVSRKEEIYLAALLHDLGRAAQLQTGTPHEEAGSRIAQKLLDQAGYPKEKQEDILKAIGGHRGNGKSNDDFIRIIKEADNRSRNCFACRAQAGCSWAQERRNKTVTR